MKTLWLTAWLLLAASLVLAWGMPTGAFEPTAAQRVEDAFARARHDDFGAVSALQPLGPALLPYLEPYLHDPDPDLRHQVIALLQAMDDPQAIPLLLQALDDRQRDVRRQAVRVLYRQHRDRLPAYPDAGVALLDSVRAGSTDAAALLLLGHFPQARPEPILRRLANGSDGAMTKLYDWKPVVPVALAARVALSRLGDEPARNALLTAIAAPQADTATLEFLLDAIDHIDSPRVLHTLTRTLDDTRTLTGGVPSGAQPQRRLADRAVDAFVQRLDLKVDFPLTDSRRYSAGQIARVRDEIRRTLPR